MRGRAAERSSLLAGLVVSLFCALFCAPAGAFCRTTTCDTDSESPPPECSRNTKDSQGCSTAGTPLFWPHGCTWFGVQEDGSQRLGISYPVFHDAVARAFGKWANVDCGGGQHPSFDVTDTDTLYGPEVCATSEYNARAANASVWMFRDASWPVTSAAGGDSDIAVALVRAEVPSGRIVDADVELNSFAQPLTSSGDDTGPDLDGVIAHEAGHFLGLAHSLDPNATMNAFYSSRTAHGGILGEDDVAGICAAYPPSATAPVCGEPEPLFGFSRFCGGASPSTTPVATARASSGCDVATHGRSSVPAWVVLVGLAAVATGWRRARGGGSVRAGAAARRFSRAARDSAA